MLDFDKIVCYNYDCALGIEDNAAIVIENEQIVGAVSSGGNAYRIYGNKETITKEKIEQV